jgi:hypothetical protein
MSWLWLSGFCIESSKENDFNLDSEAPSISLMQVLHCVQDRKKRAKSGSVPFSESVVSG